MTGEEGLPVIVRRSVDILVRTIELRVGHAISQNSRRMIQDVLVMSYNVGQIMTQVEMDLDAPWHDEAVDTLSMSASKMATSLYGLILQAEGGSDQDELNKNKNLNLGGERNMATKKKTTKDEKRYIVVDINGTNVGNVYGAGTILSKSEVEEAITGYVESNESEDLSDLEVYELRKVEVRGYVVKTLAKGSIRWGE